MGERLNETPVYRMAERLAEWGVNEIASQAKFGSVNFVRLLDPAKKKEDAET